MEHLFPSFASTTTALATTTNTNDSSSNGAATHGLTQLPTGTRIISVEYDAGITQEVDPMDRPRVLEAITYINYKILKEPGDVEIELHVKREEEAPDNIYYLLMISAPDNGIVMESQYIDKINADPFHKKRLRVSHQIRWYADYDRRRFCLNVPIDSVHNRSRIVGIEVTRISFLEHVPMFAYESEETNGSTKRKRTDKT